MLKVVVVDDYPMEGEAIKFLLGKHQPDVQYLGQALSGEAGLELILKCEPDVAFVDIKMPGMNGIELASALTEQAPKTKIVFETAFDDFKPVQMALRLGAYDYLLKPLQPQELYQIVDRLIADKQCERAGGKQQTPTGGILLDGLRDRLLQEIKRGNRTESSQAFSRFWEQLSMETQQDQEHVRVYLKAFTNGVLHSSEQGLPPVTDPQQEVLEYACRSFLHALSVVGEWAALAQSTREFVEGCTNLFNQNLYESDFEHVERARVFIEEHLDQDITLEFVARSIFISPYYLSRTFKKRTGMKFIDYVISRRIEWSKTLLLSTNQTIESIAVTVGYDEPNSFRRLFKNRVGVSPSEYRRQKGNVEACSTI